MEKYRTIVAIRHFPDRKKPCIVLEQGNQCVVLGYLTDRKREKWLYRAFGRDTKTQLAIGVDCPEKIDEIIE